MMEAAVYSETLRGPHCMTFICPNLADKRDAILAQHLLMGLNSASVERSEPVKPRFRWNFAKSLDSCEPEPAA